MIKKIENLLEIVLVCLVLWLSYNLYQGNYEENGAPDETVYTEHALSEKTGDLPARYNAREHGHAAVVKNQGAYGTCWAMAASSALEASLAPQKRQVFSTEHIVQQNSFANARNDGGDYTMTMAYLTAWQGPVLETDDPYGDGVSPEGLEPVKHVQEIQLLGEKDYEAIKRAVYTYGAVQSSIYMDMENASSTSVYYNQLQHSYYYNGTEKPNHEVLIIGWDDVYSADRFNAAAGKSGAFLCQNSWGETFGDNGTFYISYEDVYIGKKGIVYTSIEEPDNYDHIYQTDLCGWVGQVGYGDGTCWFANVYKSGGREMLEAVGFYVLGPDTEVCVYVLDKQEEMQNLLLETPAAQGRMENAGYYTVRLEEPYALSAGEEYVVAVKIMTPDTEYPVAMEYAADESTKTVDILDGEGYISHNGINWSRTEATHGANICLKAYTSDQATIIDAASAS